MLNTYGFFYETTAGRFTFAFIVVIAVALRYVMYRLRITSLDGYGMEKEAAREIRFLIPLFLLLLIALMVNQNLANFADVLFVVGISNIPASFFRLISYRLSKRYEGDVSGRETLKLLRG